MQLVYLAAGYRTNTGGGGGDEEEADVEKEVCMIVESHSNADSGRTNTGGGGGGFKCRQNERR